MYRLLLGLFCCLFLGLVGGNRKMPKLSDRKLCADEECSHPISIAVSLSDYTPPDCRFIPIRRGQTLYVFSKLKGRGRLFWLGSVQGDDYGEYTARLGYFPSSIVQEEHYLMPGKVEVKTDCSLLTSGSRIRICPQQHSNGTSCATDPLPPHVVPSCGASCSLVSSAQ